MRSLIDPVLRFYNLVDSTAQWQPGVITDPFMGGSSTWWAIAGFY